MIACVVVSDRGDLYLPGCLDSLDRQPEFKLVECRHIVDDYEHTLGMAGAVQSGFSWALKVGADYVLWVEEDFRFVDLPLGGMLEIMERHRYLAQVVLKRQPWSDVEKAAGDQLAVTPEAFTQRAGFVEHQLLFSLNPCLIRAEAMHLGWPSGGIGVGNEQGFTDRCLRYGYSFAYYGEIDDPPRCLHVGAQRSSGWRL